MAGKAPRDHWFWFTRLLLVSHLVRGLFDPLYSGGSSAAPDCELMASKFEPEPGRQRFCILLARQKYELSYFAKD